MIWILKSEDGEIETASTDLDKIKRYIKDLVICGLKKTDKMHFVESGGYPEVILIEIESLSGDKFGCGMIVGVKPLEGETKEGLEPIYKCPFCGSNWIVENGHISDCCKKCGKLFDKGMINQFGKKDEIKDVAHPICPINMYFDGDESECDVEKCDYEVGGFGCTEACKISQ